MISHRNFPDDFDVFEREQREEEALSQWERKTWDPRTAQVQSMSWPTGEVTTVDPQPEPRPRVRSHEVPRSYAPMTPAEWFWAITGAGLVVCWVGLFLLVLYAVTVG